MEVPVPDITAIMQASDMFGVEGLKDWLAFLISRDFCHFFHKVRLGGGTCSLIINDVTIRKETVFVSSILV